MPFVAHDQTNNNSTKSGAKNPITIIAILKCVNCARPSVGSVCVTKIHCNDGKVFFALHLLLTAAAAAAALFGR
jgi:hypothetical protein